MGAGLKKIFFSGLLIFLIKSNFYSQQLTVTSATACPNQSVTLQATWNNVGSVSYTIAKSSTSFTQQSSPNFPVSEISTFVYTISAQGTALSGPVTSSTTATLTIITPAPLTITNTPFYCYGGTATITAPLGSSSNYSLTGPIGTPAFAPSNNNIILVPNLSTPTYDGQYTVTANMSGCIRTGTTQISVSPNSQITVSSTSNVCQGQNVLLTATLPGATGYTWTSSSLYSTSQNTLLTAVQPTQSGVYTVNSSFGFGSPSSSSVTCARSATTAINVVQTSPVTAGPVAPSNTLCEGSNLNLSANASVSGTTPGYLWSGPNGFSSSSANPILAGVTPANSGNYSITALFFGSGLTCTTGTFVNVTVVGTVDPVIVAPANICQGSTLNVSASATGASAFNWSWPTLTTPVNSSAPTVTTNVTPSFSGVYFVTAVFNGNTSLSCPRTRSVVVNVIPVNTITVIPPTPVCQPGDAHLQSSAIGATNYSWDGPNGNVGVTPNVILYHPTLAANGIYTITALFGGAALTCTNTNTVSLLVKPLLNFTLTPATRLVCYNTNLHIDGPSGATSYSWTSSSGFETNNQNVDIPSVQPSNSGTYYLTVSLDGCLTSATTAVNVLPPIEFSQPFFNRSICRGDSIHMEAPVAGGSENIAYVWDPCVYLSACTGSVTDGIPEGTTVYNVVAYDIACPNYSISAAINVEVKQPPVSKLELEAIEGCAPLCLFLDSKTRESSVWITYDFGANLKYQQDSFSVCLKNPGTYNLKVTLTGTNECSGSYIYPQPIIVDAKPDLTIITSPEAPTLTDDITFYASTSYSVSSFMWVFDNASGAASDTSFVASPLKAYGNTGTYPVVLIGTTTQGCADTAVKFLEIRDDFNVFIPNSFTPNGDGLNDVFQLKGAGIKSDNFTMDIIDRKGQTIYSTRDLNAGWDGTYKGATAKQDIYVYKIVVIGSHNEGKKQYLGQFSLIR